MRRFYLFFFALMLSVANIYAQNTQGNDDSFKSKVAARHDEFNKRVLERYNTFRRQVNERYAQFMEKSWKRYGIEKPISMPKSKKMEPKTYDKAKELKLLQARKKKIEEEKKLLAEQQKKQEERQKNLTEQEKQQELVQQQLAEEQRRLEESKKQLELEQKKFIEEQKQQKELAVRQEQQMAEKLQLLEEKQKQQEDSQKNLDEEKTRHQQQLQLFKEELKRKEAEQNQHQAEQDVQQKEIQRKLLEEQKKLEEEQQALIAEKKKIEDERQQLLADRQKQEDDLKKETDARKQELELQEKQLEESAQKQKAQQQQLDEDKQKWEEQKKLLAEEKAKQQEEQKKIEKEVNELDNGRCIQAEVAVVKEDVKPQPQPVKPIMENEDAVAENSFGFYGTPMQVRWGKASQFKLNVTDKKAVTNAYLELTDNGYNNLLADCLKLRGEYDLCDWAYYKMLQDMSEKACGKGTNEAVFLQGVLYQQSGYMMRFGVDSQQKLHILCRMNGTVYDRAHWIAEDKKGNRLIFFLMDGSKPDNLEICDLPYDDEQAMSCSIPKLPKLNTVLSNERQFYSGEPKLVAKASVNKNMIDFFNDYPASIKDNDVTTRWPYYANAPLTKEVKEDLYNKLRPQIANTSKLMAANALLAWVQNSLQYSIDERVWGTDRAFFAEETLYYPYCDCEDHAILYSYLVRDLLGLDVVLMYHYAEPQHMYTAVCFGDENVSGDYVMLDGKKYIIADPTCHGAPVGHTMNQIDNQKTKMIPLKRL
ncbi:MAG: hypothetical protein IJV20_05835 [Prevotella sp.]|nr:hypothetical protein [Prevotella sp.]